MLNSKGRYKKNYVYGYPFGNLHYRNSTNKYSTTCCVWIKAIWVIINLLSIFK